MRAHLNFNLIIRMIFPSFIQQLLKRISLKRRTFAKVEESMYFSIKIQVEIWISLKNYTNLHIKLRFSKHFWDWNFFHPNLRLSMCLAMCLIFQQSEPSVLINRVLTEKKCVCSFELLKKHTIWAPSRPIWAPSWPIWASCRPIWAPIWPPRCLTWAQI